MRALTLGILLAAVSLGLLHANDSALAQAADGPACRTGSKAMTRTELIFGTERKHLPAVSDRQWRRFVDAEIAPRFPDGFTLLDGSGEWRGSRGVVRERSHVVIIWHGGAPVQEEAIEALRARYKQRFQQESVARLDGVGCASF